MGKDDILVEASGLLRLNKCAQVDVGTSRVYTGIGDINDKSLIPLVRFSLIRETPMHIFIYLLIHRHLNAKGVNTIKSNDQCDITFIYIS